MNWTSRTLTYKAQHAILTKVIVPDYMGVMDEGDRALIKVELLSPLFATQTITLVNDAHDILDIERIYEYYFRAAVDYRLTQAEKSGL